MTHRRKHRRGDMEIAVEHSSVQILQTEDQLRAAVQRAAAFDRRAAEILQSRWKHYAALVTESPRPLAGHVGAVQRQAVDVLQQA